MSYLALERKWRPQQFDEVAGQGHIARTLTNAIAKNRLAHAYLFTGSRGIGKTTLARILAKSLNCLESEGPTPTPCDRCSSCRDIIDGVSLDVLEIDGASTRGIDDIRDLRDNVKFAPASSRFKIYIIDEVHMLTREAFNALLKTLEEPPAHVKFFFATTDPHKIPPTIISRCQRFDLRRIPLSLLEERLSRILEQEEVKCDPGALRLIAAAADGGMRDAESILDQLLVFCEKEITANSVRELLGLVPGEVLLRLAGAVADGDVPGVLGILGEAAEQGWGTARFISALLDFFRDLLVLCSVPEGAQTLAVGENLLREAQELARRFSPPQLDFILDELICLDRESRFSLSSRTALELTLVRLARSPGRVYLPDLLRRLSALEKAAPAAVGAAPAVQPVEPTPAVNPGADWEGTWAAFLEALGQARPILKGYLGLGRALPPADGQVRVEFEEIHSFPQQALEEPQSKQFLENFLQGKLGKPVELEFSLVPSGTAPSAPAPEKPAPAPTDYDPRRDPAVRSVIDAFEGTVIRVEKARGPGPNRRGRENPPAQPKGEN